MSQPANILETQSTHHRNAIQMAFRWRADSGPFICWGCVQLISDVSSLTFGLNIRLPPYLMRAINEYETVRMFKLSDPLLVAFSLG